MEQRHIEKELFNYIDERLRDSEEAQDAIKYFDARLLMVCAAGALVGVREATGHNDGKMVSLIQETVGGHSGEPYCVAGVMSCLAYTEVKLSVTSPLMATEHAQTLWKKTPVDLRVKHFPAPGAIAIWGDVGKASGHAEIVRLAEANQFYGIGFNTSGASKPGGVVNREGNGVYYTTRSYGSTAKRKLLGFIKPFA